MSQSNAELDPMVLEAKDTILELFKVENQPLWYVCHPPISYESSPARMFSPSDKKYVVAQIGNVNSDLQGCLLSVLESVRVGLSGLFSGQCVLHDTSFWAWFFQALVFDLSAGLVVKDNDQRSEAEVRHQLLTPLLSWTAHYAHVTKTPATLEEEVSFEYSSQFDFEVATDHKSTRGRKPQVDYALSGMSHYTR